MYTTTTGLVLRESPYKESSRVLTVLTAAEGKVTVSARGVKRRGSRTAAAAQLFSFSEMTLFEERGRRTLTEARSITLFEGLREDIGLLALAAYFAELLETLAEEEVPHPELLSLGLNALYALSELGRDPELVKAAFELRLMCLAGYEPMLTGCAVCGRDDVESPVFSLSGGVLLCLGCRDGQEGETLRLSPGVLDAMRYIAAADPKRLYSFTLEENARHELGRVTERYLLTQLGSRFASLDYYHSLQTPSFPEERRPL